MIVISEMTLGEGCGIAAVSAALLVGGIAVAYALGVLFGDGPEDVDGDLREDGEDCE